MNAAPADQPSVTFYVLGGSGDLARRLLIPGLAGYLREYPGSRVTLVGAGRSEVEDYAGVVRDSLAAAGFEGEVVEQLASSASYLVTDATDSADLQQLLDSTEPGERSVLYFALSPAITTAAVEGLDKVELPDDIILAMEKPFGEDAAGARELNEKLLQITDEEHIFRIDHFNYESAVSNLTGLVGANALFSAGWHRGDIEAVEVIYDESLALEGRAEFYDNNGAVRDMLQSHLLQVMAHTLAAGAEDTTADILAATTIDPGSVRRARYTAGEIHGRRLPAYTDEEGVDPQRDTETLFQVTATVDTERWAGVPVTLRSGKAIGDPRQEIAVTYRRRGHADELQVTPGTRLVFPFSDEVAVDVNVSDHGYRHNLQRVTLQATLVPSRLSPYGRVVRAILSGRATTEVAPEAPERSWEIIEPVLRAFAEDSVPLEEYPAGSQGPADW